MKENGDGLVASWNFDGKDFDGKKDFVEPKVTSKMHDLEEGSISVCFNAKDVPDTGIAPIFYYGSKEKCPEHFDANNRGLIIELAHDPVIPRSKSLFFTEFTNEGGCKYTYPSMCFDSRSEIPENQWQHFVAVVGTRPNGEKYNTGYLNGKEMTDRHYNFGSSTCTESRTEGSDQVCHEFFKDSSIPKKDRVVWIGKGYWGGGRRGPLNPNSFFKGKIGDVKIYDKPIGKSVLEDLSRSCLERETMVRKVRK